MKLSPIRACASAPRSCAPFPTSITRTALGSLVFVIFATASVNAAPAISKLSQRGLQTEATTTLVIEGTELLPEPHVLLAVPIAQQVVKPGATANQVQIDVTLDASVPPGIYELRLVTAGGISPAVGIGIDHLPELPLADEVANLPVALSGTVAGSEVRRTSFTGQKGQKIVIEVEGRRLGVELNPMVHLLDSRGVQVAWAQPAKALFGDARLTAELPADGKYTVELHDALFRGPGPGNFRLKIGTFYYADTVFPLGVRRETKSPLEFVASNLPAGTKAEPADAPVTGPFAAPWPAIDMISGSRPKLIYSDHDELIEAAIAPGGPPQKLAAPMAVSGRLAARGEEDRYQVIVTPGQALRFDVMAAQLGSPLDGVLSIRNMAGGELAASDDRPLTPDPGLDYTVPAGVESLLVVLKDLEGRGGPEFIYRLAVTAVGQPDFGLTLFADNAALPKQQPRMMRVRAERRGYNGPIKLSLAGLPPGVVVGGQEIPAGATDTLLTLVGGDEQPMLVSVVGESTEPNTSLRHLADVANKAVAKYQPWLGHELAVAAVQPLNLAAAWGAGTADNRLPIGTPVPLEVQVTRLAGATGPVRLSLLSTQIVPRKTIKENNQDKQVDDLDRALRLDGTPMIAAEQSMAVATVLVPRDLPGIAYDLAIQAELLSPDGKVAIATATTPARRMMPVSPLSLAVAGEAKVEAKAGTGETGTLTGSIQRLGDFKPPLVVTLAGLPHDFPAPELALSPEQTEFTLPVAFPFGSPAGALANVRVVALDRSKPEAIIRSNEVPVAVNVSPGGAPPAHYRLFEDEAPFIGLLTEGGGKATLETADRYAGSGALLVTPDQKFRSKLPGLGVKIAETPGEGEFRFLRFAWKKRGGGNILLQLNGDGKFGPLKGMAGPALRYEAGPADNPYNAAAIKVDAALPAEWTVVTRDLFADFGAFRLDGLAFTASDGEAALFDHIYLARTADDLKGCPPPVAAGPVASSEKKP